MKALTKVLAGGIAAAAVFGAAPAAAQYYPYGGGYGYGYSNGGVLGSIINSVIGQPSYGYGYNQGYGNYGMNQQAAVSQCTAAVQQRLGGGYGGYGYSNYGSGGGRVLGISRIEPRGDGGLTVRGVASSGAYGYGNQPDLTFKCRSDYRGVVYDVSLNRASSAYGGYGYSSPYNTYNYNSYSTGPYGYSRY